MPGLSFKAGCKERCEGLNVGRAEDGPASPPPPDAPFTATLRMSLLSSVPASPLWKGDADSDDLEGSFLL